MDNDLPLAGVKPPVAESTLSIAKPYIGQEGVSVGGFTNIIFTTEDINAT